MVDITEIRCPHCKGTVTLNKQNNVVLCDYCGKTVAVDGLSKPPPPIVDRSFVVNSEGG
jgi:DNA-directed RNA polymerase subunit RPC12/RpoP